jgi:hypothetical protein
MQHALLTPCDSGSATWYVDVAKLNDDVTANMRQANVTVKAYGKL